MDALSEALAGMLRTQRDLDLRLARVEETLRLRPLRAEPLPPHPPPKPEPEPVPVAAEPAAPPPLPPPLRLETNFGLTIVNRLGVITLLLGIAFGFKWLVVTDPELDGLVTRIHGANTTMVEHGLGPRLLCAVFGFVPKTPPGDGAVRLVYLLKQGTFYPFAPTGPDQRDNELELRVRSFVGDDLPIEKDLSRWMALWNLPVS